jgi:alpha-L-arabinofuranosidase
VQKLYGNNSGDKYIPAQISLSDKTEDVRLRIGVSVVEDSETNDLIVKLVNLLPVEVNSEINLSEFNIKEQKAILSVLQGTPDDNKAKPIMSQINVSEKLAYSLPAYSFSVIRINKNEIH